MIDDLLVVLFFAVFRATTRAPIAVRAFSHAAPAGDDVVIPELVSTLEWVLDSPPNVHQFEEPPVSAYFTRVFFEP